MFLMGMIIQWKLKLKLLDVTKKAKPKLSFFSFHECEKDPDEVLTDNDFTTAMRNMKKIACGANDLIGLVENWTIEKDTKHMCTPFEVEWWCAHVEQQSAVDGVMSSDGNCVALGVKKLNFNANFNSETLQECDESVGILSVDDDHFFLWVQKIAINSVFSMKWSHETHVKCGFFYCAQQSTAYISCVACVQHNEHMQ